MNPHGKPYEDLPPGRPPEGGRGSWVLALLLLAPVVLTVALAVLAILIWGRCEP